MSGVGIALPSSCLVDKDSLRGAFEQVRRAGVTVLQVQLASLLSSTVGSLLMHLAAAAGLEIVLHLEETDDLFSLPREVKASSSWTSCVVHLPDSTDDEDALIWCARRLASRRVRLLVENSDDPNEAARFSRVARASREFGLCFDIGHHLVARTDISQDEELIGRIDLLHLHGVDLSIPTCHLAPWVGGVVDEALLARILIQRPQIPVIIEMKSIYINDLTGLIESVRKKLLNISIFYGAEIREY